MSGVPGSGGPVPKRSTERRRRNKPEVPVTFGAARPAPQPPSSKDWHKLAREWYLSLGRSGQSDFYQPSDWATAKVWAEALSRALQSEEKIPASLLAAWSAGATSLLATEGDRRRMRLELQRATPDGPAGDEVEDELDAHRNRTRGPRQPPGDDARGTA